MNIHPELLKYRSSVESRKEGIALGYLAKLFPYPQYRTKSAFQNSCWRKFQQMRAQPKSRNA